MQQPSDMGYHRTMSDGIKQAWALRVTVDAWDTVNDKDIEVSHIFTPAQVTVDPRRDAVGEMGCTFQELVEDFEEEYEVTIDHGGEGDHTLELTVADYDPNALDIEDACGDLLARIIQYVRGDRT